MAILIWENAFKRLLILLILLLFALLLLYTDYLQEVNFYQNKLQLGEFKVNFDTYKLLQESSLLSQHQLKNINTKLENQELVGQKYDGKSTGASKKKAHRKDDKNKMIEKQAVVKDESIESGSTELQYFTLTPPFPEIDLTSIGPIFLENGLAHLYCEYSFDTIRCTVGGRIPAEKIYFPTAYFTNPNFEDIVVSFGLKELLEFFNFRGFWNTENIEDERTMGLGWIGQQILKSNAMNIELFTNYIMLFGSNGTNMNLFNHLSEFAIEEDSDTELSISKRYKYYTFIHTQVCVLFLIIYLKLLNFVSFSFSLLFQFSVHIPIYAFNCFKYGKHSDELSADSFLTSETNMTGFEEWIANNERVELQLLSEGLTIINMPISKTYDQLHPCDSKLRMRKISTGSQSTYGNSEGYSTGVEETFSTRIQDIRKLYDYIEKKPLEDSSSPAVQYSVLSTPPIMRVTNDIENQIASISTNKFRESESTLISGAISLPESALVPSSLNDLVDKYYLFYLSICFYFLMHLVVYEIINFISYNLISGIFEVISTSNPDHLNVEVKSIFQAPEILVDPGNHKSSVIAGSTSKRVLTHGNQIFDALLNVVGCILNFILALIFHSIYTFCIYTYTISVY